MGSSSTKLAASKKGMTSFYSLTAVTSDGSIKKMEDFRGKVVYATNVASKWGRSRCRCHCRCCFCSYSLSRLRFDSTPFVTRCNKLTVWNFFFSEWINNPLFKQKVLLNASMLSSQVCMSDGVEISYPFLDSRAENLDGRNLRRMKRSKNSPNQKTFLASWWS